MPTDYEQLYRETDHVLGAPTKEFVDFFAGYRKAEARVLDIGCGQGRDALFIARLGHSFTGVDHSPSGIADLIRDAKKEELQIRGEVADLRFYQTKRLYDVVVIDRTLHMLDSNVQSTVLTRLIPFVDNDGFILIADEPKNISQLQTVFDESETQWRIALKERGLLFLQRR